MKQLNKLTIIALIIFALASCTKDKKVAREANVSFEFQNYVGNEKVTTTAGTPYTNAAGNPYNVSMLKYYISNIVLVDAMGNEVAFNNHTLIDAFGDFEDALTDAKVVANGDYVKMKFLFGVDADNNTTGTQSGDLDPSRGMFWSWNSGYIFSKHEGQFQDITNATKNIEYHLGKQAMATEIEIPLTGVSVNGKTKRIFIKFDLNNMYNNPVIDFNTGSTSKHSGTADAQWMSDMKANLGDVFSYLSNEDFLEE